MLRPVDVHDVRFLRDMLRHAYHWRLSEDSERPVYRYVSNWGRRGDTGVMALEDEFEMEIPDEQAEKITTVQQAIDYAKAHVKA